MAHNQYQFQQAISKQGLKLQPCSCSAWSFPIVEYHPGKSVRIYCKNGCGIVTLERGTMTEEDFVKTAAVKYNTGRWDK